jgi:hypothetical protein
MRRWIYLIPALATMLAACAGPAATDSSGSDLSAGGGSAKKKSTEPAPSNPKPPLPGDDGPIDVPPLSPNSPRLSALTPLSVQESSGDVEVSITGTNISPQATVTIGGEQVRPTSTNGTALTVTVSGKHLRSPGSVAIKVQNPSAKEGATSNALALTVTSASSEIAISGVSPAEVIEGSDDLTLTVSGSGFTGKSRISFNGTPLSTSPSSGSQLTATVPAGLLQLAGQASVAVFDPSTSAMSAPQTFVIDRAPDSAATSACGDMRCIDFGFKPGQCLEDFTCDASGCLVEQGCSTPSCQYDCATYQYGEGQCFGGWVCQSGCLAPKDSCPDSQGSSSSTGTDAGSCTFACVDPDGAWSYEAGECKDGYQCGNDGCLSPSDCTTAGLTTTDPACTTCVDPDGAWSYTEGECKDGFCCSGGCLNTDSNPGAF